MGAAAAAAETAGTIASRNGRASTVPIPRRNVLRGSAIFVMIIKLSSPATIGGTPARVPWTSVADRGDFRRFGVSSPVQERVAPHDSDDERLEPVIVLRCVGNNPPNGRHVVVLEAAAKR